MKEYQLVVSDRIAGNGAKYCAYYSAANAPPRYALGQEVVVGNTVMDVIRKAKKIAPDDGVVVFTYLDRK